jgi:hypothetical protein
MEHTISISECLFHIFFPPHITCHIDYSHKISCYTWKIISTEYQQLWRANCVIEVTKTFQTHFILFSWKGDAHTLSPSFSYKVSQSQ